MKPFCPFEMSTRNEAGIHLSLFTCDKLWHAQQNGCVIALNPVIWRPSYQPRGRKQQEKFIRKCRLPLRSLINERNNTVSHKMNVFECSRWFLSASGIQMKRVSKEKRHSQERLQAHNTTVLNSHLPSFIQRPWQINEKTCSTVLFCNCLYFLSSSESMWRCDQNFQVSAP